MCQAYESEARFVSYLESKAPYCPLCKEAKAIFYPHCGKCQSIAFQSCQMERPVCSCKECEEDTKRYKALDYNPHNGRSIYVKQKYCFKCQKYSIKCYCNT